MVLTHISYTKATPTNRVPSLMRKRLWMSYLKPPNNASQKKGGTLIRNFSTQAAAEFDDDSIDFVYLDGDHQYQAIKQDIAAWYGKVRSGGILAGHDYVKGSLVEEFGVIPAVNEFVEQHQLELNTTNEKYATWWETKP